MSALGELHDFSSCGLTELAAARAWAPLGPWESNMGLSTPPRVVSIEILNKTGENPTGISKNSHDHEKEIHPSAIGRPPSPGHGSTRSTRPPVLKEHSEERRDLVRDFDGCCSLARDTTPSPQRPLPITAPQAFIIPIADCSGAGRSPKRPRTKGLRSPPPPASADNRSLPL
jgi:hypothetical protein